MPYDEIMVRLLPLARDIFQDDELELTPETTAADVDAWDSLTNVELMVAIEQEFGVRFSTGEVANMRNVGELVAAIGRQTGG